MDNSIFISNPNPRERANKLSVLLWCWTIGLFKKGYSQDLGPKNLYDPLKSDKSNKLGDKLEKKWKKEVQNAKKSKREPSLLKTIFHTFFIEICILGFNHILNDIVLRFNTPFLLGALLQYFKLEPATTFEKAVIYASCISISSFVGAISMNQYVFEALHLGGQIRIAVCSLVYRKSLRLSKTALGETASGKIVNLVANDVSRFDFVCFLIHYLWSSPLLTIIIGYFLYQEVGYAGLIGLIPTFVVVPIQACLGKWTSILRLRTAIKTDKRIRLMDEIVSGIEVIKMYAWEKPFCALVGKARQSELKVVKKSSFIRGIYMMFNIFTPRVALYSTSIIILLNGNEFTADKVFLCTAYFNVLAATISGLFIRGIAEIAECKVAVKRLQDFLTLEEVNTVKGTNNLLAIENLIDSNKENSTINNIKPNISYIDEDKKNDEHVVNKQQDTVAKSNSDIDDKNNVRVVNDKNLAIKLSQVTSKWNIHSSDSTLEDINVEIEEGKMYVVIGTVGSGKSSLLSTILGETNIIKGNIKINGTISFADQDVWVFGSSVRQNILFGQKFDYHKYHKVVKVCALLQDFKQFPQGDQTIVGERGCSLSGGQKARINLARAVYRQADIYLLDDPLSAVDAHVGNYLFEECMRKYLKDKTRILATHQLQFLQNADRIFLLDQGKMSIYNNHIELLDAHPEYNQILVEEKKKEPNKKSLTGNSQNSRRSSASSIESRSLNATERDINEFEDNDNNKVQADLTDGKSENKIQNNLMLHYFKIGASVTYTFVIIFFFILTQVMASLTDLFIPVLLKAEKSRTYYENRTKSSVKESNLTMNKTVSIYNKEDILPVNYYIYIYTALILSIFIVGIIRSFSFYSYCVRCAQHLHDLAFRGLIRASMRFFDTNPSGRILNRFSKDMGSVDELLPKAMMDAGQAVLLLIGSLVIPCVVNPYFLIPVTLVGALFYWFRIIYLKTSNKIKRLEGSTRSPVFTHLNATLNGLSTIRAFQAQSILTSEFDQYQDINTSAWYMYIVTGSAFGFSLDICCFFLISFFVFSFLFMKENFTGGEVGLVITQLIMMIGQLQWGMRQSAAMTNHLTAVERVLEYTKIPPESNLHNKTNNLNKKKTKQCDESISTPNDWPSHGKIEFIEVYLHYVEEDEPVLKNLNLIIEPTEKIGIVGRTGAGKSSLIAALFRLAKVEGVINIDGIDTGSIVLEDLRKRISIIPQNPFLFSGTLRYNLDPFEEFPDQILWEALEEVELKEAIQASGSGLNYKVHDQGTNFSVGQRQLVCLARAILRNNKILLLDEATANVDPQTDALIQRTIRTKFSQCSVLTIAHRLNTIMDSDKVLVMEDGQIKEFDHPHLLLLKDNSNFTSLVKETGPAMYETLCKVALEAYTAKNFNIKL